MTRGGISTLDTMDCFVPRNDRLQFLPQFLLRDTSKIGGNIEFENERWFLVVVCHLSHTFLSTAYTKKRSSSLTTCIIIVDKYPLQLWTKPIGKQMVNNSISKSRNKNLSHHWIGDIDEFVVIGDIGSRYDFALKLNTVFLKVLLPKQSLRSSSLATTTVKVCLKYISEHRVPARKQRRA